MCLTVLFLECQGLKLPVISPLLVLLGLLMYLSLGLLVLHMQKASTVPQLPPSPSLIPNLKISQDTKLPETSFLSVLIRLHTLPRRGSAPAGCLC